MKILFVYPDMISPDPKWQGYFYEGLAVLSAVARNAGHDTHLLHVARPLSDEAVVEWVEKHMGTQEDTIVAFSVTANQFPHVKRWAPLIQKETGLRTLAGGMHATLSPKDCLGADGIDMICKGDGEVPLVNLLNNLDAGKGPADVKGIWFKDEDGAFVEQPLDLLADLNTLPTPHWEIFPNFESLEYTRDNVGVHMGSRGCPYDCAYCCNRALIDESKGRGRYMRFKKVDRFIAELKTYLDRYPDTWAFVFEDDIFGVSKKWMAEFADKYPKAIGLPYGCNMRPNLVKKELVEMFAASGCQRVNMAIESGNDEVRNFILNRNLSRERVVNAFKLFKDAGVEVKSFNIVGSPHETPAAVLDTIKINAEIDPQFMQHTIFYPYEGTPLYDMVHRENLVADREVTDYFQDTALDQESIRRDQVIMFNKYFEPLVRHYRRMSELPGPLATLGTALTDRFLVWDGAPDAFDTARKVRDAFRVNGNGKNGNGSNGHGTNGNGTNGQNGTQAKKDGNGSNGTAEKKRDRVPTSTAC